MIQQGRLEFRLFDMFGVPVFVNYSFLIIVLMFVLDLPPALGLSFALVLAASVLLHEFGHILAARGFGVRARRVTLSVIGGCASLDRIPSSAGGEFLTAIAGPAVSFALSGVSIVLLLFSSPPSFIAPVLYYGFWLNLVLGCFNLLPGFPMDGGRVFRSLMMKFVSRSKATKIAMIVGRIVAAGIVLRGLLLWLEGAGRLPFIEIFIAVMIWREGWREYQMSLYDEYFRG